MGNDEIRVLPTIEPIAVSERDASKALGISPRLLRNLIERGDVTPIKIPGIRRILFATDDLKALVQSWKQT
jgi:hypothetical protein